MASLHDETLAFMQEIGLSASGKAGGKASAAKKRKESAKPTQQPPQEKAQQPQRQKEQKQSQDVAGAQRKRKLTQQQQQQQQQQQPREQKGSAAKPVHAPKQAEKPATHIKFNDGEVEQVRTYKRSTQQPAGHIAPTLQFAQLEGGKKWYDIRVDGGSGNKKDKNDKRDARKKHSKKQLTYAQMEAMRGTAEQQWQAETAAFAAQRKQNQTADDKWVQDVISTGTLSDKVAALTLLIQQSPIHNSQLLDNLVNMATKKERRMAELATRALKDLLINDLLPDRRLMRFEQRLQEAGGDTLSPREAIMYIFEDHLKLKYGVLLRALEEGLKDTIETHRRFCLEVCFDLLANKPEKEDVLLRLLVNKLGDPMKKIAGKALELLSKLAARHNAMVETIVDEVQVFLQRPNLGSRATFNAIIFLSSIRFSNSQQGARAAEKVIGIYFTLFEQNLKGAENEAKIVAALLTGVNRAFPFLRNPSNAFKEKLETLFKIVHTSSFNTAVQALGLIFQLVTVSKQSEEEQESLSKRFYRALYSIVLSKEVLSRSRNTVFLNLMYRAMKHDSAPSRVLAFCKRLCAMALQAPSPIAAACMRLLSVALSAQPTVKSSIVAAQKFEASKDAKESESNSNSKNDDADDKVADQPYDPLKREPLYAVQGNPGAWEGVLYRSHFHPSVSKMAESFFTGENVAYDGDPMVDFALRTFLDKFTYKNPKQSHAKHVRKPTEEAPVNSESFVHQHVQEISPDAVFFHKYFNDLQKLQEAGLTRKKKKKVSQDDAEERALYGEDDEEAEMDRFADELAESLMRDHAAGSGMPIDDDDDDFSDFSYDGGEAELDNVDNDEDEDEDDEDDEDQDIDENDDEDNDDGAPGNDFGDNFEDEDLDEDEDEDGDDDVDPFGDFEEEAPTKKSKSKASKAHKDAPIFASAEDYEDLASNIYDNVAASDGVDPSNADASSSAQGGRAKRKQTSKSSKRAKLRRK